MDWIPGNQIGRLGLETEALEILFASSWTFSVMLATIQPSAFRISVLIDMRKFMNEYLCGEEKMTKLNFLTWK
jgi:hypothetical protein